MTAAHTPTPLQAAISRAIYVPVQQVTVTNWHAPLPHGQFYATPQDRVQELIKQAEALDNSHEALVAALRDIANYTPSSTVQPALIARAALEKLDIPWMCSDLRAALNQPCGELNVETNTMVRT